MVDFGPLASVLIVVLLLNCISIFAYAFNRLAEELSREDEEGQTLVYIALMGISAIVFMALMVDAFTRLQSPDASAEDGNGLASIRVVSSGANASEPCASGQIPMLDFPAPILLPPPVVFYAVPQALQQAN